MLWDLREGEEAEHPERHADVDEEADDVVHDLDEWAGGKGRIDVEFLQSQGYEGAEDRSEYHDAEE